MPMPAMIRCWRRRSERCWGAQPGRGRGIMTEHIWYTPAECAALLHAAKHGDHWRAPCPAHGGDNRQSLAIKEGRDRDGQPMTLLHCFAQQCTVADICQAMGIAVCNLFCTQPAYAKTTRSA